MNIALGEIKIKYFSKCSILCEQSNLKFTCNYPYLNSCNNVMSKITIRDAEYIYIYIEYDTYKTKSYMKLTNLKQT